MVTINTANSLRIGIQKDFQETWRQKYPIFEKQQKLWLRFLPWKTPTQRKSEYVWKESIPFPTPWPYGTARQYQTFKDRRLDIALYPYELSIPFSGWDEQDDQLQDTRTHLASCAQRFLQIPDKLIAEYLNGVASLNPALYNAYDGVGIYSALDGDANNRFGAAGGNIVAGSGANTAGIIHDFALAQRRFLDFLDPSGESPIFSEEDVAYSKMTAIIPNSLNEIFQTATKSEYLRIDSANQVSQTNWLKGTFSYRINPYLTNDTDWYIIIDHGYWKPFGCRMPGNKGIRQIFADFNNSDRAREYNEYAVHTDVRVGLAPWSTWSTVKINNV